MTGHAPEDFGHADCDTCNEARWSREPPTAQGMFWVYIERAGELTVDLVSVDDELVVMVIRTRSRNRFKAPTFLAWQKLGDAPEPPGWAR